MERSAISFASAAGRIDSITDAVIERQSRYSDPHFPQTQGRAARNSKGRIGKFGWKGQVASLSEFVKTACAVELGLEVPDHPQSPEPTIPPSKAPGLDLSDGECDAIVDYLASLPSPISKTPFDATAAGTIQEGSEVFKAIGCASCHVQKLGDVDGLYSDLLLHDMGPNLRDSAVYYGTSVPTAKRIQDFASRAEPANEDEWRTPPLWGIRDSRPYLHDGRADTLEKAILLHGGTAEASAGLFRKLNWRSRQQLVIFLNSLSAPRLIETKPPVVRLAAASAKRPPLVRFGTK